MWGRGRGKRVVLGYRLCRCENLVIVARGSEDMVRGWAGAQGLVLWGQGRGEGLGCGTGCCCGGLLSAALGSKDMVRGWAGAQALWVCKCSFVTQGSEDMVSSWAGAQGTVLWGQGHGEGWGWEFRMWRHEGLPPATLGSQDVARSWAGM